MSDESNEFEGFRVADSSEPVDEFAAPGRSVFGDDDISFEDDDDAIPHWSEPPTGSVPQVGGDASMTFEPNPEPTLPEAEPDELAAWADVSSTPRLTDDGPDTAPPVQLGEVSDAADDFFGFDDDHDAGRLGGSMTEPASAGEEPSLGASLGAVAGASGDRDMPMEVIVGVALAVLFFAAMAVGPVAALVIVTIALSLAAVEFPNAVRVAGYQPAVLLVHCRALPAACGLLEGRGGDRARPRAGDPVRLALVRHGHQPRRCHAWPRRNAARHRAHRRARRFAALMLSVDTYGTGVLTVAVILTVFYDIGGLFIGKALGRTHCRPPAPTRPWKVSSVAWSSC